MDISNIKNLVEKTKKLKVLYVEDNEMTREQTLKVLGSFFDDIDIAVDGVCGLEQYKEHHDLVICDIIMPNMNGVEMAKAIQKKNHHQNIIVVTAHNTSEQLQELMGIGITNYIHKPIKIDSLTSELQKVIKNIEGKKSEDKEFQAIQVLNHELDTLVDSFDTYVIASRTDLKGDITYSSKAYENISGYKKSELIGKPHNIVRHPDMPSSAFKEMWQTIKSGKLWTGVVKNLRKDGTHYWVKANIAPYYDKEKNHIGYSAIRLDITAQKEVEELHSQVNNLLDNAAQGFLSFNKEMKIEKSFSKECLNIFERDDIYNLNISDTLFKNDAVKKDLFDDGIGRVLSSDEAMIKEMFLSLLPKEHTLNDKDVEIEYKLLDNDNIMLVLTDITDTKKLQKQLKVQDQTQKMIVAVASDKNDFITLKFDFESFISKPSSDLKLLLRELHTYKGIFAQKEMVHITQGIHDIESKIAENGYIQIQSLQDIFDLDLEIISATLGEEFLTSNSSINVDINALDSLELKIKQLKSDNCDEVLNDILYDFEKFKYESIYTILNSYPTLVKQMAQKLEKEVYPLEIIGDKELSVATKYKPFMKSLVHLFNNCIDHGIEDIETRAENEKDEIGTVSCKFEKIDNILQIVISDDGVGIDVEKLTANAIEKGIEIEDEKLHLVFADSLSTKEELSTTSGRGVGMSAIKSEIDKLDGNIEIKNEIGSGVEFIFTLPLEN